MEKLLSGCEKVMVNVAAGCIFLMMCLTTADALGRYLLSMPMRGAYEVTEQYLQVGCAFLGMWYAYRRGAFIRVTFLVDHLPKRVKVSVEHFILVFSFLSMFFFVGATFKQFLRTIDSGMKLDIWDLPLWPSYLIIPIGLFFTGLAMVIDLRKMRTEKEDLFKEEPPTTSRKI
jgi:TRAP-type C4-dicarboxylate transport system permease small subunit